MQMFDAISVAVDVLNENVGATIERMEGQHEDFSQDEAFRTLIEITELKALIKEHETRLNMLLTQHMRMNGEKLLEMGNFIAERKFSSNRKNWNHQPLLEAVINRALSSDSSVVVDPATGEIIDLTAIAKPLIDAVVDNVTKAARLSDWRVTALRAMVPGLNPDDFCESEKTERVSIRRKQ